MRGTTTPCRTATWSTVTGASARERCKSSGSAWTNRISASRELSLATPRPAVNLLRCLLMTYKLNVAYTDHLHGKLIDNKVGKDSLISGESSRKVKSLFFSSDFCFVCYTNGVN